jgi:D-sedoheptulose 7-phosphate isomerase
MKTTDYRYIKKYFNSFKIRLDEVVDNFSEISKVKKLLINLKKKKKKILIFGNGGSAAIASHFSVDLTKYGNIRCVNFNESDLITCFANDYGYENWIAKAIEFYADPGDYLILISSSGKSKNMIEACKQARKSKLKKIFTFTGFSKNNPLKKFGHINIWVNSKIYNHIENIHQIILLSLIDLIKKTKIK